VKNVQPYDVKAIVNNVKSVFQSEDIGKLNRPTYEFIIQHMGFIAHYDLSGFQATYQDLRVFLKKLQTSEYSQDETHNLRQAYRQETDNDFKSWYGEVYNRSIAVAIRGIIKITETYGSKIYLAFGKKEEYAELTFAKELANKYGFELKKIEK
jgi:hypothetical protein